MKADRTQNESALVCVARDGDKEALQTLLKRNWTWLKGLVYSVLANTQDLDDVMQEVCLRVITRIHTLREPERFRAWLAVLARREAIRQRRRKRQEAGRVLPTDSHTSEGPMMGMIHLVREDGCANDPAADIEKKELCGRVLDAVRKLPEKYRVVFVLAHSGELTYAQIAEVLDIPITTIQIRLVRARRMIRDRIAQGSENKVRENERCG
jgi:RNA polymerase sigma-70 factor (ECF subfamily)